MPSPQPEVVQRQQNKSPAAQGISLTSGGRQAVLHRSQKVLVNELSLIVTLGLLPCLLLKLFKVSSAVC